MSHVCSESYHYEPYESNRFGWGAMRTSAESPSFLPEPQQFVSSYTGALPHSWHSEELAGVCQKMSARASNVACSKYQPRKGRWASRDHGNAKQSKAEERVDASRVEKHQHAHIIGETSQSPALTEASGQQLVGALAVVLTVHCARSARANCEGLEDSLFHAMYEPKSGIRDFLSDIRKNLKCSKECLVLALIYIDRIVEANSCIRITNMSVHRILVTAILIASKFQDDNGFDNAHYAKVGGLSLQAMNKLEVYFLERIRWKLLVMPDDYDWYCNLVSMAIP